MPMTCCIFKCRSRALKDSGIKFFRFPAIPTRCLKYKVLAEQRQRAWLTAINRKDLKITSLKYSFVCSKHFLSGKSAALNDVLNPDWIPSVELGYQKNKKCSTARYDRMKKRTSLMVKQDQIATKPEKMPNLEPEVRIDEDLDDVRAVPMFHEKACQTEEFYFECDKNDAIYKLKQQITALKEENAALRHTNLRTTTKSKMNDLRNSTKKTKYFTGFEKFNTLEVIYNDVERFLPVNLNGKMTSFDVFLMTFIKLRLDLPFTYLALHYNVSGKTISELFYKAIIAIHARISCFVFWPDNKSSIVNSPPMFKKLFGNKPVFIIDCFEVYSVRPGNFLARANTFSSYKHHQTLKYLICISSFGSIAFISKGYGGRCSDKFVFESCGILNFISENDIILADRGFLIESAIQNKKARLIMPAFKNVKSQMELITIENNRKIASIRIHVERVIGVLRQKFPITTNRQSISVISKKINNNMFFDYMVKISCAVFNLNPSIILDLQ